MSKSPQKNSSLINSTILDEPRSTPSEVRAHDLEIERLARYPLALSGLENSFYSLIEIKYRYSKWFCQYLTCHVGNKIKAVTNSSAKMVMLNSLIEFTLFSFEKICYVQR